MRPEFVILDLLPEEVNDRCLRGRLFEHFLAKKMLLKLGGLETKMAVERKSNTQSTEV